MKCPKCGYTSFPYLDSCRKCGRTLAEPRAALGLYTLRPDPPDLLLAYQTVSTDITGTTPMPPVAAPSIDLGHLDEIEPELATAQATAPRPDESGEPVDPAPKLIPMLDQEVIAAAEVPPLEPSAEPRSAEEMVRPPTLDLNELADMTLELENAVNLGDKSAESPQTPKDSPDEQPVYDLDLDEDLDELTLQPLVDESDTGEANDGEEVLEYTLEIEDDLEFEIDELELEQDDDAEDEDDDER
jgi:hypothetical protein